MEHVKLEKSAADEQNLLYEQSDLRIEVVELTRLAAIKVRQHILKCETGKKYRIYRVLNCESLVVLKTNHYLQVIIMTSLMQKLVGTKRPIVDKMKKKMLLQM